MVLAGLVAACYYLLTILLSPISFGPIQLRVAGILVPCVLLGRGYHLGVVFGLLLANLFSPFGWYDYFIMPILMYGIVSLGYVLRAYPFGSIILMAILSAISVSVFPLYFGAGIPIYPTVLFIFAAQCIVFLSGWYGLWVRVKDYIDL